jgi:hypothetical protein
VSLGGRAAGIAFRLAAVAESLGEIHRDLKALREGLAAERADDSAAEWVQALEGAVEQMQLDCIEARFAARELGNALPGVESVQPRLL